MLKLNGINTTETKIKSRGKEKIEKNSKSLPAKPGDCLVGGSVRLSYPFGDAWITAESLVQLPCSYKDIKDTQDEAFNLAKEDVSERLESLKRFVKTGSY